MAEEPGDPGRRRSRADTCSRGSPTSRCISSPGSSAGRRRWRRRTIDVRNLAIAVDGVPRAARAKPGYPCRLRRRPSASPSPTRTRPWMTRSSRRSCSWSSPRIPAVPIPPSGTCCASRARCVPRCLAADPPGPVDLNNRSIRLVEPRHGVPKDGACVGRRSTLGQSRETAFHPITSTKAAGFMEEAGWLWVTNYGDVDAEYRAVREGVGMWDLSPLNKWEFRGAEALEAAQRVHTNDILGMRDGQVRYGAFVDEDGLLVDDGTVFRHSASTCGCARTGTSAPTTSPTPRRGSRSRSPTSRRSCRACRSRGRRAATSCARSSPAPTSTRFGTSRSSPSR